MRAKNLSLWSACVGTTAAALSGCNFSSLIPPIPIDLGDQASYNVTAGTPAAKRFLFANGLDSPVAISGGSFNIDPAAITINIDSTGQKHLLAAQDGINVETCLDACDLAGVDEETCGTVCQEGRLIVTAWAGTVEAITADCKSGDEYQFDVTLNEDLRPTAVSVDPDSIRSTTRDLLDSDDGFGLCIEVISPVDGEVIIEGLTFRVQL